METSKLALASLPVHISTVSTQAEKGMNARAPLTAVYIHTVPVQLPQTHVPFPAASNAAPSAALHLAMPPLTVKEKLPFLTLHIANGSQPQACIAAGKAKSSGKHVCPHCGRDCMKPSVLEKHLRCHTGERPYPCNTCGVSFKTQSNLYKHKRTQAHARHSSESEHSNLDSSRETCTSSCSLEEHEDESDSMERNILFLPRSETPANTTGFNCAHVQSSGNDIQEHNVDRKESEKLPKEPTTQKAEAKTPHLISGRHFPLQRQEAMQWENFSSKRKPQSHESTDSGFSENSDHYPSPSSAGMDHILHSISKSFKESVEETTSPPPSSSGRSQVEQEPKQIRKDPEQRTLEERISKLISDNLAVVEDKQLDHVRPRKTVLSKQGSIDLPMPYTYKDSFHFDLKINSPQKSGFLQRHKRTELYNSVPTQRAPTVEHPSLTRSSSLPYSVTLLQPERSSPTSFRQRDCVTLTRRGSSGQIHPTDLATTLVSQHSSTHRTLVRQAAVDCNHATDVPFPSSAMEEASLGGLGCNGDGAEPSGKKFRRKKTQKFAYNKWYMYGGGTFKKLYSVAQGGESAPSKGRKCSTNTEHEVEHWLQNRESGMTTESQISFPMNKAATYAHPARASPSSSLDSSLPSSHLDSSRSHSKAPLRRNVSLSVPTLPMNVSVINANTRVGKQISVETQTCSQPTLDPPMGQNPPKSKKMKTDETTVSLNGLNKNPVNVQLGRSFLLPSALSPAAKSAITSTTPSVPSATRSSFLPMYQLELPSVSSTSPSHTGELKKVGECTHDSVLPPLYANSGEMSSRNLATSLLNSNAGQHKTLSCSEQKIIWPPEPTPNHQAEMSHPSHSFSHPVVHRQSAAATTTTSWLDNHPSEMSCTLKHSLKPASDLVPVQSLTPLAAAATTANPILTKAGKQTSAAAVTTLVQHSSVSRTPLSHTFSSSLSGQSCSTTKSVSCSVATSGHVQPAQNVFHMHTADLQICLQIISDEQLALIEPQIEHSLDSVPQRGKEVGQDVARSRTEENQVNMATADTEKLTFHPSRTFAKGDLTRDYTTGQAVSTTASSITELVQNPLNCSSLRQIGQCSLGNCNPTTAVENISDQTLRDKQPLHVTLSAEIQLLKDNKVSNQSQVGVSFHSNNTGNSKRVKGADLEDESHHKLKNAGVLSSPSTANRSRGALVFVSSKLEKEECFRSAEKAKHIQFISSDNSDKCSPTKRGNPAGHVCNNQLVESAFCTERGGNRLLGQKISGPSEEGSLMVGAGQGKFQTTEHPAGHAEQEQWRSEAPHNPEKQKSECMVPEGDHHRGVLDTKIQVDSAPISSSSNQHPLYFSQTNSGMSVCSADRSQQAPKKSNNLHLPAGSFHAAPSKSSLLENNLLHPPQQSCTGSIILSQQTHVPCKAVPSGKVTVQVNPAETTSLREKESLPAPVSFLNEIEQGDSNARSDNIAVCCKSTVLRDRNICNFTPDFLTFPSTQVIQMSHNSQASTGWSRDNLPAANTWSIGSPSNTPTCKKPEETQNMAYKISKNSQSQSSDSSRYQSNFIAGLLYGLQPSEYLASAVRPVPICQQNTEDTSSSDDEGKLIIEL